MSEHKIQLREDIEARLRQQAANEGLGIDEYLQDLINSLLEMDDQYANKLRQLMERRSDPNTGSLSQGDRKVYEAATPDEWADEFLRWTATFPVVKTSLPDEALRRESMYEDQA